MPGVMMLAAWNNARMNTKRIFRFVLAAAILWLCSNDAAMVTGHVLAVDGGWTAR